MDDALDRSGLSDFNPRPVLEYDDIDLVQRVTDIQSRKTDVDPTGRFSRRITLKLPLVSSAMDTVTEDALAIVMAEHGGLGVLHRACSIEEQVEMVRNVKRSTNHPVEDLLLLTPGQTISDALSVLKEYPRVSGLLIVERRNSRKLVGVLSRRDISGEPHDRSVRDLMNAGGRLNLVTAAHGIDFEEAWQVLHEYRIEKLPLVDRKGRLTGLITEKDIVKMRKYGNATRDADGRLVVGAAIGIEPRDCYPRAEALIEAGVDVIVIDVAHGALTRVPEVVATLVERYPDIDIVAGNVMSVETMMPLIEAGAAGVKAGIAPGYACRTRDVTGVGGGQATVVSDCAQAALPYDVPVCADGGIREPGDISKALALGAQSVMFGSLFAGTDESPGEIKTREDGVLVKTYRGMATADASVILQAISQGTKEDQTVYTTPEGAELEVPAIGALAPILIKMEGAIRATMSYTGARTVDEMPKQAVWTRKARSGQSK